MTEREITVRMTEHPNAFEAIQHLEVSGDDRAIMLGGKYLTLNTAEAEKLEASGTEFAYLVYHEPTGQIMTIPVDGRTAP